MNKINQIAFAGTSNIAPHNWQTTFKDKPRMLKAMESFDKFVREELPDDVEVDVKLFKRDTSKGITGGSDVTFDLDLDDDQLKELLGQEPATLPVTRRTPLKDIEVEIEARSDKKSIGFNSLLSAESFKYGSKETWKSLLSLFA